MKAIDPIIDADLNAYVDGELDVDRRIQVES
ncbi:anti-sigma factor, partial [Rhizobium ruizarguesonis]